LSECSFDIYKGKNKYLEMKNILTIIFVVICLILIGWALYHYLGKHITELENCNKKYKEDIENLKSRSDSLQPKIKEAEEKIVVLTKERQDLKDEVVKWKGLIEKQEKNSKRLKDSVNKYKKEFEDNKKKYDGLKKSQKQPTNQQTLEFFEKY